MSKPDDGCGPVVSGGLEEDGLSCLRQGHSYLPRISECMDSEAETVMQLRNELRDKEMKLTDIRLEALSSAHQLDQLREAMNRMQVRAQACGQSTWLSGKEHQEAALRHTPRLPHSLVAPLCSPSPSVFTGPPMCAYSPRFRKYKTNHLLCAELAVALLLPLRCLQLAFKAFYRILGTLHLPATHHPLHPPGPSHQPEGATDCSLCVPRSFSFLLFLHRDVHLHIQIGLFPQGSARCLFPCKAFPGPAAGRVSVLV